MTITAIIFIFIRILRLVFFALFVSWMFYKLLLKYNLVSPRVEIKVNLLVSKLSKFFLPVTSRYQLARERVLQWYNKSRLKRELALTEQPQWKIESDPRFLSQFLKEHPWIEKFSSISFVILLLNILVLSPFFGKTLSLFLFLCALPGTILFIGIQGIRSVFVLSQWRKIWVWNPGPHPEAMMWNLGKYTWDGVAKVGVVIGSFIVTLHGTDEICARNGIKRPVDVEQKALHAYNWAVPEGSERRQNALIGRRIKEEIEWNKISEDGRIYIDSRKIVEQQQADLEKIHGTGHSHDQMQKLMDKRTQDLIKYKKPPTNPPTS